MQGTGNLAEGWDSEQLKKTSTIGQMSVLFISLIVCGCPQICDRVCHLCNKPHRTLGESVRHMEGKANSFISI